MAFAQKIAGMEKPISNLALDAEVIIFAAQSLLIAERRTVIDLGPVANTEKIIEKTGLDVSGFRRILDNYGVRHTMKQHGDAVKEARRGQVAVTLDDFRLIQVITSQPDDIFADGKNKIGRDVIVFVKLIEGIGYRHVEEVRGKHKLVATDSLRKKKALGAPKNTPATSACWLSPPSLNVRNGFAGEHKL